MISSVMTLLALATLNLLLSVGSATTEQGPHATGTPCVQPPVRIHTPLATECDPDEVVAFLNGFFDAFNRGDASALADMFPSIGVYPRADNHGFQWYSVSDEGGNFVTYDPSELPIYLAARHRHHEQMRLLALSVRSGGYESGFLRPEVNVLFHLQREADDLQPHVMNGKGAMYCDPYKIFVWSMAQDKPEPE